MPDEPDFPPEHSGLPPVPSDPPPVIPPVPSDPSPADPPPVIPPVPPDTPPATPGVLPAPPDLPSAPPDPPSTPPDPPSTPPAGPSAAEPASRPATRPPTVRETLVTGCTRHDGQDRARGFAAGGELDQMGPGPVLAWHAAGVIDDGLGTLDDDELIGLLCAARRLSSWAAFIEVRAVSQLAACCRACSCRRGR